MLSTLTIISIFTEIFAAGILIAGAVTFLKNYFSWKKLKDLLFALVFLTLFIYVAATIASQMMFNLGRGLSELILVHKGIYVSIILCAVFVWAFLIEKFQLKKLRLSNVPIILLAGWFVARILGSSVNLIYREGIVEPLVFFSQYVPVKPFFSFIWMLLALASFVFAWRSTGGQRKLTLYLGGSTVILLSALLCSSLYVREAEAGYLVASWVLILISTLGFLLAELIPPQAPEAIRPLHFFRTRILFKLMLIFVLLIVILFETTTLATINISKNALSKSIIGNYLRLAHELAQKINALPVEPPLEQLQQLVVAAKMDDKGMAFLVDQQGKLIAHPDQKRALQKEDVSANQAAQRVILGQQGGAEFQDEIGSTMVGAYVPITKYGWGVVVQEPLASAYSEIRRLETNSLLFVVIGIILTALVGIFFARSIERPIKELTSGTEAVAKGDLRWYVAVDSSDEIGKLAKAFNQMTKDLRESQERLILSEKLASLGTMAAGMAHEIKNPLVSIRTFTQILTQKWEDKEFREKFASIIPNEIERINRIAESLLKFGKPMKPELGKVEVNGLLEEVLLLFESECKKYNIRVTKKLAELPEITGDAGQLQQVFVNIVKNGIESMHSKGGEMIVKTDIGEVIRLGKMRREGKKKGGEMVWGEEEEFDRPVPVIFIEISDTGEGIPEENLKSLFDPFFTTKMTGTGMGLPITLRIIEEHKGSVKVRSSAGKGTSFIITLPKKA
ncbi:MAG: HAMP domain-containing protein [Candidatus Margulisbacteria bacterium]|nr:HAMP domain-containing protein [Candidatus Margulisiibacteriota bacterium]